MASEVETSLDFKIGTRPNSPVRGALFDGTMSEAGDAFGEVEDGFASDLAGSDDNLESVHDEEEEEDGEDLMDNVLECVPSPSDKESHLCAPDRPMRKTKTQTRPHP